MPIDQSHINVTYPPSGVVKSTQRLKFWADSHLISRESQNIGCSTQNFGLNVERGRVCVASQTSEGQSTSACLTRPRLILRRLRCQRASKLSWFSALPFSSQLAARLSPRRLQNQSRLWLNQAWTRCNYIVFGSALSVGSAFPSHSVNFNNHTSNWRLLCLTASKHSPFLALPFFLPLVAQQLKSLLKKHRWLWTNHTWTRCNHVFRGSALAADPHPAPLKRSGPGAPGNSFFRKFKFVDPRLTRGALPC